VTPEGSRLFVLARHAECTANVAAVVNSNPADAVPLTARGEEQAHTLGAQVANLDIGLALASRFLRTQQTLSLALRGRSIPLLIDRGFDEIDAGDFNGAPITGYWSWKEHHTWRQRFPHGESVAEALLRYSRALRRLLARTETVTIVIVHQFTLHHVAAAAEPRSFQAPPTAFDHAVPYLFDEQAIDRAVGHLDSIARSALSRPVPGRAGAPPASPGHHQPGADEP
jgi:alpha-ribazole phosphatase